MEAILSLRIHSHSEIGCTVSDSAGSKRLDRRFAIRSDRVCRPEIRISKSEASAGFDACQQRIYTDEFYVIDGLRNETFYLPHHTVRMSAELCHAASADT